MQNAIQSSDVKQVRQLLDQNNAYTVIDVDGIRISLAAYAVKQYLKNKTTSTRAVVELFLEHGYDPYDIAVDGSETTGIQLIAQADDIDAFLLVDRHLGGFWLPCVYTCIAWECIRADALVVFSYILKTRHVDVQHLHDCTASTHQIYRDLLTSHGARLPTLFEKLKSLFFG